MRCLVRRREMSGVIDSARLVQALGQREPRIRQSSLWTIARCGGRVVLALCAVFWVLVVGVLVSELVWSLR